MLTNKRKGGSGLLLNGRRGHTLSKVDSCAFISKNSNTTLINLPSFNKRKCYLRIKSGLKRSNMMSNHYCNGAHSEFNKDLQRDTSLKRAGSVYSMI